MENSEEIRQIKKAIWGNGQPGLMVTVTELKTNFDTMNEAINNFGKSIKALAESQIEHDVTEKAKIKFDEEKDEAKNFRLKMLAVIVTISNVVLVLISVILKF